MTPVRVRTRPKALPLKGEGWVGVYDGRDGRRAPAARSPSPGPSPQGRGVVLFAALLVLGSAIVARATPPGSVDEATILADAMPRTLAEYGFFADAATQVPGKGVVPYRLNVPLYSDGAEKLRFVYIPAGKQAVSMGPDLLQLPVGSALIKTFAFTENGKRRLIETRLLLHRAEGWVALPYLWNAEQTEAKLALAGARVPVTTPSGERIEYRVPNKNQCKECHGLDGAVIPIGPKGRNLSGEWLGAWMDAGKLDRVDDGMDTMIDWDHREGWPAYLLARAYLDVNCAHCHQPGGSASNSGLDLRLEQRDRAALGVMKRPVAAGRGAGALLYDIVPGKPEESILVHRMASTEPDVAMPELGKDTVDAQGLAVFRKWIAEGAK